MDLSDNGQKLTIKIKNSDKIVECNVVSRDLDFSRPLNEFGNIAQNSNDFKKFDDRIVTVIDAINIDGEILKKLQKNTWNKDIKVQMPTKKDSNGNQFWDTTHYYIELLNGKKFANADQETQDNNNFKQESDTKRLYSIKAFKGKVPDLADPICDDNGNIKDFKIYKKEEFLGQKGSEIKEKVVAKIKITETLPSDNSGFDNFLPHDNNPVYPIIPDNKPIKPDNKPTVKPIETIAGEDRYDTAIEVAKEIAENGSVVLVNGNALVDGLAAAPLASSVSTTNKVKAAPILLTKTDKLTTSTKDYIEELVSQKKSLGAGKLRVYIVGGEAVVSKNVEKELSDLGVEIIRAGGKNREETSLKVADLMSEKQKSSNAFVVGADGEADAMSIASIAASRKEPIIVSRKGGLSKVAIEKMASLKNTSATIIGGDKVVSANTEKSLKEANINSDRVAGVNRQDTNAKIINRYASSRLDKILVSKDGQNKKDELVDALTATSLAVKYNAPIVLATNKISDAQIKAIKDNANTKGISISQIGHGIAESVINTIAEKVGLIK